MTSAVKEKTDRATTPMMESGGLNEVFGNMPIDSKPVATDGERGRYREITVDYGAGESVVNPDEWPNDDLKPSKGLSERTTIRGPRT